MTDLGHGFPPLAHVRAIVQRALDEDVTWGDVTTDNSVPDDQRSRAILLAKINADPFPWTFYVHGILSIPLHSTLRVVRVGRQWRRATRRTCRPR